MSSPLNNIFAPIEQQGQFQEFAGLYEKRMINSSEGKMLYMAASPIPNADPDEAVWDVRMLEYDANGYLDRYRLPDNGIGFKYTFTDITTYFS